MQNTLRGLIPLSKVFIYLFNLISMTEENTLQDNDELELDDIDILDIEEDDNLSENISADDYHREKNHRIKAEKRLVELKKELKELKEQKQNQEGIMTKAEYAMEKFMDKNPELSEYREDFEKFVKKGNSLEEAKILVLNSDKSIENRQKLESMSITDGDGNPTKSTITRKELEAMSQEEYNKTRELMKSGKIKIR